MKAKVVFINKKTKTYFAEGRTLQEVLDKAEERFYEETHRLYDDFEISVIDPTDWDVAPDEEE